MTTEVDFAKKFVQLLEVTTPSADAQQAFADSFHLNSIRRLPVNFTFPLLSHPFGATRENALIESNVNKDDGEEEEVIAVVEFTFKSLKQPKFNLKLALDIKPSTNIYMVKSSLAQLLEESPQTAIVVQPADIKLMIRTKTLQDSENVSRVLETAGSKDSLSLNVLISQFKAKAEEKESSPDVSIPGHATITDASWSKISDILLQDLKDQAKVDQTIRGFKNSL
ncbi:hypothetical protein PMKS-003042 [Pichia membranifaciens]|uniref:Ubiquitin-like domain-containing protein n=1 Tax=Pichia membranifaciens TaxID=4926 RepID=A0A1Q2YJ91_9ASCO|nr:hypothetical protein PMKS-003042 [Pichia membranifaciens]